MGAGGLNRRRGQSVFVACAAAVALALPAAAVAQEKPSVDPHFVVIEKLRSEGTKDGVHTIRDDLYRAGKKIGTDRLRCTSSKNGTHCDAVYRLPEGVITASGAVGAGTGAIKITGGSKAYEGASGGVRGKLIRRHTIKLIFDLDR